jgi:hypothetical protein
LAGLVPFGAAAKLGTTQLAVGALLLAGAGAGSALLVAGDRDASETERAMVETSARTVEPEFSLAPKRASPPEPAPSSSASPSLKPASSSASAFARQESASSLADEVRLLRDAEGARKRGDASASLRLLSEMAERFPASTLTEERLALTVLARCDLGETSTAVATFERLRQSFPNTVHSQRLAASCVASTASFEDP